MAMVRPSAYSVALRLQRVPRALQGRVRVSRALHGREGRLTRLAPAPRALGGRAMSDDEQPLTVSARENSFGSAVVSEGREACRKGRRGHSWRARVLPARGLDGALGTFQLRHMAL